MVVQTAVCWVAGLADERVDDLDSRSAVLRVTLWVGARAGSSVDNLVGLWGHR